MLFFLSYSAKKMRMRRFFHLVRILFMVFTESWEEEQLGGASADAQS